MEMMKPDNSSEQGLFQTSTSISDSKSWLSSIRRQFRERREDRDAPKAEITAEPDPTVLQKFVAAPSLLRSILNLISDTVSPRKLETTIAPVEVEEIWTKRSYKAPGLISFAVHVAIIGILLIPVAMLTPPAPTETSVVLLSPPPDLILNLPKQGRSGGGGGGGMKTPTPPSKGRPPRGADKQLTPPVVEVKNLDPDLIVEPTIVAPQLSNLPQLSILQLGDPNGVVGPPSAGPGTGGGIGTGTGRGVGSGDGPGLGPGSGGGTGGGIYSVGGGVTEPRIRYRLDPEYSDDARKARAQGTVELLIVVREDGTVDFQNVTKRLGYGLDQKAIDAVRKWRFEPGKKDGKPVATYVQVQVNFALR
jgi:TonB family protein